MENHLPCESKLDDLFDNKEFIQEIDHTLFIEYNYDT
jgi:hypothetical protein